MINVLLKLIKIIKIAATVTKQFVGMMINSPNLESPTEVKMLLNEGNYCKMIIKNNFNNPLK